jgi:hypothetical protein
VLELGESQVIDMMTKVEENPQVKTFSLPSVGDEKTPRHIELGAKGEPHAVEEALKYFQSEVVRLGGVWRESLHG